LNTHLACQSGAQGHVAYRSGSGGMSGLGSWRSARSTITATDLWGLWR